MFSLTLLEHEPTLHLSEIRQRIEDVAGFVVDTSTICCTLQRLHWSRKVVQNVATQRCMECRVDFITEVIMVLPARAFVWVDETSCQCRDCLRNRGRGLVEVRLTRYQKGRNKNITLLPTEIATNW